jgi:SAM-dependent methyltransferase
MAGNLYLDERRASVESLRGAIDDRYAQISQVSLEDSYTFTGECQSFPLSTQRGRLDFLDIVDQMIVEHDGHLRVLDIGAGACRPLVIVKSQYGDDVDVVGVTAHTTEEMEKDASGRINLHGVDVRVGNADYWEKVVGLNETYDLIVSRWGIGWLVDPLAAVERALSQLADGGVLLVEPTCIRTQPEATGAIIDAMTDAGFDPGRGWKVRRGNYQALSNYLAVAKHSDYAGPLFGGLEYYAHDMNYRFLLTNTDYQGPASIGYSCI